VSTATNVEYMPLLLSALWLTTAGLIYNPGKLNPSFVGVPLVLLES